uniref:Protein RAE1 n=1 Tax=Aegilops tauschii subsp. strangulata TaxID=200361 RepID=A0A453MJN5_AEGTS
MVLHIFLRQRVNNLDSADSQLTHATSTGYSNYPSALFFANINSRGYPHLESNVSSPCLIWPAFLRDDGSLYIPRNDLASGSTNVQQSSSSLAQNVLASDAENQQSDQSVTPMDVCPGEPSASSDVQMPSTSNSLPLPAIARPSRSAVDRMPVNSFTTSGLDVQMFLRNSEGGNHHHDLFSDSRSWELPFLHGWLMAQSQTGASSSIPIPAGSTRGSNRHYASRPHASASVPGVGNSLLGPQIDEAEARAASLGVGSELATSLFSAGAAELPCTVKLRVWRHDIKNPCVALETKACCLTISHAVLCSEMGAHFSPCGRFLVACVACLLPQTEGDQGNQLPVQYESTGAGTSPTRHPLPSHGVIYELRVYSLEEATFGEILTSRAIRAAHCLTSIQFSPTSEHILLAYGRRHSSLLRSIVMDAETTGIPVYTILEVYRVSDMELVRVLPSAEDEVNVACFHPSPGGGLVYGTKEGKLRILQHNGADAASMGLNCFIEENMLEVQRYALEG